MSDDPNNNSGNNPAPQQVLTWNGNLNGTGGWQTVPVNTTNTSASPFIPNGTTYTFTIGGGGAGGNAQQIPLPLELDLPKQPEEKKKNSDGCVCKKCKELFPHAEPNQEDGTLICYSCRITW